MRFRDGVRPPPAASVLRVLRRRRQVDDQRTTADVIAVDFVRRRVLLPDEEARVERHLRVVRVPGEGR